MFIWKYLNKFSLLVYLAVASALSYFLPLPDLLKAFLALPAFLFLPIKLGSFFSNLKIISWSWGILILTVLGYLFYALKLLDIFKPFDTFKFLNFETFVILVILLLIIVSIFKKQTLIKAKHNLDWWLIFAVILSFVPLVFMTYYSPYPFFHDTDQFNHNKFIYELLENKFPFLKTERAFLPSLHLVLAVLTAIFNLSNNPLPLFWVARFLVYPLYALGLYLFAGELSKNKKIAFFTALIAPWFTIEYISLINFAPKIVSYILVPFLLYLALKNKKLLIAPLVAGLALHLPMGLINTAVVLLVLAGQYFFGKIKKIALAGSYVLFGSSLVYFFLQWSNLIKLKGHSLIIWSAPFWQYNFHEHYQKFIASFSPLVLMIFLGGIILSIRQRAMIFMPALAFVVFLYFSPIADIHRALPSIIPLTAYFVASALFMAWDKCKKYKWAWPLLAIFFVVFLIGLGQPYYKKIKNWIKNPATEGYFSIITPSDWRMMQWIKDNTSEEIEIISDPVTASATAGYANRESAILKLEKIVEYNEKNLIIISGRTSYWLRHPQNKRVQYAPNIPRKFKTFSSFSKFIDNFDLVYSEPNKIYVFRPKS